MAISISISRACLALLLVVAAAPCASQSNGPLTQAVIQGAVNAIFGGLGGKPASASADTSPDSKPASGSADPIHAAAPVSGKVVVINQRLIAVDGEHPSDPRWAGKQIKDTPLFNFFDSHPISRLGEYFPRIGIRIDDYSQSLVSEDVPLYRRFNGMPGAVPRALECIKFTAMVWMTEKQSQRIDNVVLCSSDISSKDGYVSKSLLQLYKNMNGPLTISSMQVRTLGPRVPERLLPYFTSADQELYEQGQYLFASLFGQLGYQVDRDQRLWFVNLAAPAK